MNEIVPFSPVHRDAVVALILAIERDEFGVPVTIDDQPDLLDIPALYQHGAGNFWVALADGEVVGTIALFDIGNDQGALRKMFVHAKYRGEPHRVGQRLLDTLIAWCKEHNVRDVFLGTIATFQAALRFYARNGFREMSKAELPPTFPIMAVDHIFYGKHV